jgi:DNA-binding winged helix-turn-helix (wHTH) protein/tetratricopeptide (TPR) repeat protein
VTQLRFGRCAFDPDSRSVACDGHRIPLTAKSSELLAILLEEPNAVVSSETLRERLWPAGYIEPSNLTQQIYVLRRALAVDPTVAIETVARRGYRLRARAPAAVQRNAAPVSRWSVRTLAAGATAIAALILLPTASSERREVTTTVDAPALRSYQLGRYFWERRGTDNLRRAAGYFERAVAVAPASALGYAGLADVWGVIADDIPMTNPDHAVFAARALANADTAVARDPQSAVAHAARGLALVEVKYESSPDAMAEYQRAIELDPVNAEAHEWYAIQLLTAGDFRGASRNFEAAAEVQPENVAITSWRAWIRYYLHNSDEAVAEFRTALEINPSYEMAEFGIVCALVDRGRYRDAQHELRTVRTTTLSSARAMRALAAIVDLKLGLRQAADAETRSLRAEKVARGIGDDDEYVVVAYALDGRIEDARRLRNLMHMEKKPLLWRRMLAMDPLIGPVLRRL